MSRMLSTLLGTDLSLHANMQAQWGQPDTVSYSATISACETYHCLKTAFSLLVQMQA